MLKLNRRKFIATSVALAASSIVKTNAMEIKNTSQIAHQVYFWLKNPGSIEDRTKLIEGVKTLSKIKEIKKLTIGIVAATEKRTVIDDTWSVSELAVFDDIAGEAAYQIHPIHEDFIKKYSHLWDKVVIYDSAVI